MSTPFGLRNPTPRVPSPKTGRLSSSVHGTRGPSPRTERPPERVTRNALYVGLCRFADPGLAVVVLVTLFVASNLSQMPHGMQDFLALRVTVKNVALVVVFFLLWRVLFAWCGLYDWRYIRSRRSEAFRLALACGLASVPALIFPVTSVSGAFQLSTVLHFWVLVTLTTVVVRNASRTVVGAGIRERRRAVIVGSGPRAHRLYDDLLEHESRDYEVAGFVDSDFESAAPEIRALALGTLEDFETLIMHRAVDEVLIALPIRSRYHEIQQVIAVCERVGTPVKHLADVFEHSRSTPRLDAEAPVALLSMPSVPDDVRTVIKRVLDVGGASLSLVLLGPIMILAALSIKLTSRGPVLFPQERYGLNRSRFRMLKFRTMVADAEMQQQFLEEHNEAQGPIFKIRCDPRVTTVGRFLRRTSMDELPQLFNVLRGEMSLVGPRPLPMRDVQRFSEAWLMRRFSVIPGMTGLWQVNSRRTLQFDSLMADDLRYIDEWSLGLDFQILARTPWAVLQGQRGD